MSDSHPHLMKHRTWLHSSSDIFSSKLRQLPCFLSINGGAPSLICVHRLVLSHYVLMETLAGKACVRLHGKQRGNTTSRNQQGGTQLETWFSVLRSSHYALFPLSCEVAMPLGFSSVPCGWQLLDSTG